MKSQKYFFWYVNYLTDLTVFEMYVMLTNAHEAKCIFLHFFSSFLNFFFYKFVQKEGNIKTFISFCKLFNSLQKVGYLD